MNQSLEAIVETFEFVENIVASNINDSLGTLRQAVFLQRLPGYLLGSARAWTPGNDNDLVAFPLEKSAYFAADEACAASDDNLTL